MKILRDMNHPSLLKLKIKFYLLVVTTILSFAIKTLSLSMKYPIMMGGFSNGYDVEIEGFAFTLSGDLVFAGQSNDL